MAIGNSAGISFSGLSSGLDTDSIIRQLGSLERQPISRLRRQQALLQAQKGAYENFRSTLVGLNTAISSFNMPNAFNGMKATTSAADAVSISASAGGDSGIREVVVNRLATAQRLSSSSQASATTALGFAGSFSVNNKSVAIEAGDSLQVVARKINDASAGVTASVVNGGNGQAFLTLTASETGASNAIRLSDTVGSDPISQREGVLSRLGLASVAAFSGPLEGAVSASVRDANAPLDAVLGSSIGIREVEVNGVKFDFNFSTGNLNQLAERINQISGVEATVVQEDGASRLQIVSGGSLRVTGLDELGPEFGPINRTYASQTATTLVQAQDAEYKLDGITFTSSSNTLKNVFNGSTVTLLQADPNKRVNLSVSRDNDGVMTNIRGFVTAYNRVNGFIRENSKFDSTTFDAGPLFGDSLATQVASVLNGSVFANAQGVSNLRNLTQIGFALNEAGELTINESTLRTALETNPESLADLFRANGRGSNSQLDYVSSSGKTKASVGDGFEVNITRAATQTAIRGAADQTAPTVSEEVIRFSGAAFGTTGYSLTIPAGSTQDDIVNRINSDRRLTDKVSASIQDGRIVLTSKRWGAASNFDVSSSAAAAGNTSGIGTSGQATKTLGLDVQGTINGEAATGAGRFLTGNAGNLNTEGLSLEYSGTTTGVVGRMAYSRGVASLMSDSLDSFLNFQSGLFATTSTSLDGQIKDLDSQITRIDERARSRELDLRNRFAAMENAIQRSQQQLARLQQSLRQ